MGTLEDTSRAKITVGMDMVEMTIITLVEESNWDFSDDGWGFNNVGWVVNVGTEMF